MKQCFKCLGTKPLSDFYPNKGMKDGHLNKCKKCARADVKKYREKNIERVRAYDRQRGNRQDGVYRLNYYRKNKQRIAERRKIYRQKKENE